MSKTSRNSWSQATGTIVCFHVTHITEEQPRTSQALTSHFPQSYQPATLYPQVGLEASPLVHSPGAALDSCITGR